jgi:hypothetical protein
MRSNHPHNHHQPISPPKKISYPENLFFLNKVDVNRRLQFPACNERIFFSLFTFSFSFSSGYTISQLRGVKQNKNEVRIMHCTHSFIFIQQTSLQRGRENGNVRYLR